MPGRRAGNVVHEPSVGQDRAGRYRPSAYTAARRQRAPRCLSLCLRASRDFVMLHHPPRWPAGRRSPARSAPVPVRGADRVGVRISPSGKPGKPGKWGGIRAAIRGPPPAKRRKYETRVDCLSACDRAARQRGGTPSRIAAMLPLALPEGALHRPDHRRRAAAAGAGPGSRPLSRHRDVANSRAEAVRRAPGPASERRAGAAPGRLLLLEWHGQHRPRVSRRDG